MRTKTFEFEPIEKTIAKIDKKLNENELLKRVVLLEIEVKMLRRQRDEAEDRLNELFGKYGVD